MVNEEIINIVLIFDKNLGEQSKVTIGSIIANTKANLNFFLYVDGHLYNSIDLTSYHKQFDHLLSDNQKATFNFKLMEDDKIKCFPNFKLSRISKASAYRLNLQELFLDGVDYCIYLDIDLIVDMDILELWEQRLTVSNVAGAIDLVCLNYKNDPEFKYQESMEDRDKYAYINSGVMIINIKSWYEQNIIEKFRQSGENLKDVIQFIDQDIINDVFREKVNYLDEKYNKLSYKFDGMPFENKLTDNYIIHFAGPGKPWLKGTCSAWSESNFSLVKYAKYVKLTKVKELYYIFNFFTGFDNKQFEYKFKKLLYTFINKNKVPKYDNKLKIINSIATIINNN